jgi:hypothetical protein
VLLRERRVCTLKVKKKRGLGIRSRHVHKPMPPQTDGGRMNGRTTDRRTD